MWLADLFGTSKQQRFFELLRRQTALLAQATKKLAAYVESGNANLADEIADLERHADETLQALIGAIRDTFVTPLDRQDLYYLGEAIDDMLDYVNSAASEFRLFAVAPTPAMRSMCGILLEAAGEIDSAIAAISNDTPAAYAHARSASSAENRMEDLNRSTLAELFEGDDVHTMLKLREIYRHFSNSADCADAIGKLIGKIIVKTT